MEAFKWVNPSENCNDLRWRKSEVKRNFYLDVLEGWCLSLVNRATTSHHFVKQASHINFCFIIEAEAIALLRPLPTRRISLARGDKQWHSVKRVAQQHT